ncbi:PREDICTED: putative F-box protein At3g21130 [Camelina sativa]|uniref:F-box protein At3g21130 n=1 Tax=Camelina sativa TaxID=90675 RepID=A0ABM0XRS0_CAMSA|nr:PREDICTED: putative F-box protein At3g21130 [Camelina sativa]
MHLPEALVVEILSRVPAVSLARLRLTSERLNALVKDGRLANKHSAYAPRQPPLLIMLIDFRVYLVSVDLHRVNKKDVPSAKVTGQISLKYPLSNNSSEEPLSNNSSKEVDICNVFHCDGLLLCTTKDNRLVVWNPCTGETRWIVQPILSYEGFNHYALGYDYESSCYKILRMYPGRVPTQTKYQVYDFTSKLWENIGETGSWSIPRIQSLGISVKGSTYWLAYCRRELGVFLLNVDFSTERFQSLPLPEDAPRSYFDVALSVTRSEEQKLCLLAVWSSEVWIATKMESAGDISWSKFLTVSKFDLRSHFRCCIGMSTSFLVDQENKVVLSCNNSVFSKNFIQIVGKDKYMHEDDQNGAKSPTTRLLTYVPGLAQIQQGISLDKRSITVGITE